MAKTVSDKIRLILWVRAAGRCQYKGCNEYLLGDIISGAEKLNKAYVAHIVAREPEGPRGDVVRSPQLANDIENVMLLCDAHHRLIDKEDVEGHPESRLLSMKKKHEDKVMSATAIQNDMGTHVVLYGARIGEHDFPVRYSLAKQAILPERYPLEQHGLALNIIGCQFKEDEPHYWSFQVENLKRQFLENVRNRIQRGTISHISVFALAPQPLLIELGRLLSDISASDIFQLHREPEQTWEWQNDGPRITFETTQSDQTAGKIVALKLALSATVSDERIQNVFSSEVPIWSITAENPHNDILRHRKDLGAFRALLRQAFDRIKSHHGEHTEIHLFPALPVSAAIEVGRTWMPKADLPLIVYDHVRGQGGFIKRTQIDNDGNKEAA